MADEPELPLFPLRAVLFPGGLLNLKVFEARYLDLISACLRECRPFGVIMLRFGREVRHQEVSVDIESTGTLAELIDVDSEQTGILHVRCRGTQRFAIRSSRQRGDGLWLALADPLPDDDPVAPTGTLIEAARGLANAITTLEARHTRPFLEPYRFDDAGWVANRWCEILPITALAKQKLMELPDPIVRLQLIDEFLRKKGVVG
jgi:Lon protease-like protein